MNVHRVTFVHKGHRQHTQKEKKMVTGNYHGLFESEIYKEFQSIVGKGNITRSFKEFMETTIATNNNQIDGINIKIIDQEIEKLTKKLSKIGAELKKNQEIKEKHEENLQKIKENDLKMEKERIENAKKCVKCGNLINEDLKKHQVNKGIMGHGCWMATPPREMAKWL